jgi:hypothetical protein
LPSIVIAPRRLGQHESYEQEARDEATQVRVHGDPVCGSARRGQAQQQVDDEELEDDDPRR